MNELSAALKIVLSNMYVMYFKGHTYHWNVEGPNFAEYHDFFGDIYGEVYGAIDPTAEHIRTLDVYAPISLADVLSSKTIDEDTAKPATVAMMVNNLDKANKEVVAALNKAFEIANTNNNQGVANFVAERLDIHAKHGWMLRSLSKTGS